MTTFSDQVFQYGGVPVGGARFSSPWATHWFVDYDNGSAHQSGKKPTEAFQTITQAVAAASGGDVIYINPRTYKLGTGFNRYVEDVSVTLGGSGGSGVVATNANMSIIGITPNPVATDFLGVRWKYTTATPLTVDAPCLHIENIGFFTESGTYHVNLRCNGATRTQEGTTGFSAYNCAFKGDADLYANGGNEIQIVNCRFQAKHDGTVSRINFVGSANAVARPIIRGCEFIGGNANNMTAAPIVGAAPWYDAMIRDCYFLAETDTTEYINIAGSTSTGAVLNCYLPVTYDAGQIVQGGLSSAGLFFYDGLASAV